MRTLRAKPAATHDVATRSTLEARWAIFFHEVGLEWQYEPTTLHCEDCSYTPDFEIKELGYVEIKPTLELFIEESAERILKITAADPALAIYAFIGGNVDLSMGVALYQAGKIYVPTLRQMIHRIGQARDRGVPFDVHEVNLRRAMGIARTRRLHSEWEEVGDVIRNVIEKLKGGEIVRLDTP